MSGSWTKTVIFDLRLTNREVFVLPENEGCAFGVEVGGDREVGIGEIVRRHLGEVVSVGKGLSLTNMEGQERGEGRR